MWREREKVELKEKEWRVGKGGGWRRPEMELEEEKLGGEKKKRRSVATAFEVAEQEEMEMVVVVASFGGVFFGCGR